MLSARETMMVGAVLAVGTLTACQTPCAGDTDCPSGQRCNLALKTPACQQLYTGGTAATCSSGLFCESKNCIAQACAAPGQPAPLGNVTPVTATYVTNTQGQFVAGIFFSDDARNDCAALNARMEYGNRASLIFSPVTVTEGQVIPWVTDQSVRTGAATPPWAVFTKDALSGLSLHTKTGTATIVHTPTASDASFVVTLVSADGVVSANYTARPSCP